MDAIALSSVGRVKNRSTGFHIISNEQRKFTKVRRSFHNKHPVYKFKFDVRSFCRLTDRS